jgi:hypothetical protein
VFGWPAAAWLVMVGICVLTMYKLRSKQMLFFLAVANPNSISTASPFE